MLKSRASSTAAPAIRIKVHSSSQATSPYQTSRSILVLSIDRLTRSSRRGMVPNTPAGADSPVGDRRTRVRGADGLGGPLGGPAGGTQRIPNREHCALTTSCVPGGGAAHRRVIESPRSKMAGADFASVLEITLFCSALFLAGLFCKRVRRPTLPTRCTTQRLTFSARSSVRSSGLAPSSAR